LDINNLKNHEVVEEMFHAPMNMETTITFSILFIAAPIALVPENQQVFAANPGTVGHLYEGGIPGYPYFGGYPNYGGFPYITGYPYNTGGDHSYDYGYGHPYNGDNHHHHHHHHHTY
jgi:hypothetical protein